MAESVAETVHWLAEATALDPADVAAELALGKRRRAFVVGELIDAGYAGGPLLLHVMRLTGADEQQAVALIRHELERLAAARRSSLDRGTADGPGPGDASGSPPT